jgi:methylated-DNA-[protein]-cysteine S-methyltransferase
MSAYWRTIETPVGAITLAVDADDWVTAEFESLHSDRPRGIEDRRLLPEVSAWVQACLRERVGPPPIPVPRASPFRRACWISCRAIPIGHTSTYTELATEAGNAKAARAAGSAMRNNPVSLLTPCHRVVAVSGMGGYAGTVRDASPNLRLKREILDLERQIAKGAGDRPRDISPKRCR